MNKNYDNMIQPIMYIGAIYTETPFSISANSSYFK